jgi:hypothetical protein
MKSRESGRWKPAQWSERTLFKNFNVIIRTAVAEADAWIGPHEARILQAQLVALKRSERSRRMLQRAGVKMLEAA